MDNHTFVASIITHLAWPVVVLLLVGYVLIFYKTQLQLVLERLASLKAAGWEIQFKDQIKVIEAVTENAGDSSPATGLSLAPTVSAPVVIQALKIAETAPSAAILHMWAAVEQQLTSTVEKIAKGRFPKLPSTAHQNTLWLIEQEYLPPPLVSKIGHLRGARNSIAHSATQIASYEDAKAYITLSRQVIDILNNLSEL